MKKRYIPACALLLSLFMTVSVFASSLKDAKKELDSVSKNIEEAKDELTQIEEEKDEVRRQLNAIEKELKAKEDELAAVEKQLIKTQSELETTQQELQATEDELTQTQEELEELRADLDEAIHQAEEQERLNAARLRAMYMNSTASYLELLLESKSLNDLLNRVDMIVQMITYDQQVFENMLLYRDEVEDKKIACEDQEQKILDCLKEIEQKKSELEQKENEIKAAKKHISRQKSEIQTAQTEKEKLMSQLSEEEVRIREELNQMDKESKELEQKIRELTKAEEERRKAEEANKKADRGGSGKSHSSTGMIWPVPGYSHISSPFGYRIHPITKEYRMHKGIDISGVNIKNKPAAAVQDGTVILAQYYGTYGNTVIIDHGGGITSLYAHGSSINVSVGQQVKKGDTVLLIGSTGRSIGPHLHFEVRENGTPVNPLNYVPR